MTIAEALRVGEGATIISRYTSPPLRPLRVTRVWINQGRTIVRFWVHSLRLWIDAEGAPHPPRGTRWDTARCQWVSAGQERSA